MHIPDTFVTGIQEKPISVPENPTFERYKKQKQKIEQSRMNDANLRTALYTQH